MILPRNSEHLETDVAQIAIKVQKREQRFNSKSKPVSNWTGSGEEAYISQQPFPQIFTCPTSSSTPGKTLSSLGIPLLTQMGKSFQALWKCSFSPLRIYQFSLIFRYILSCVTCFKAQRGEKKVFSNQFQINDW